MHKKTTHYVKKKFVQKAEYPGIHICGYIYHEYSMSYSYSS